jgi:hypothetical protein
MHGPMNVKLRYRSSTAFTKIVLRIPGTVIACVSLRFTWLGLAVASWTDLRSVQIAQHVEEPGTARWPWSKRRRNNERGNRCTHFKVLYLHIYHRDYSDVLFFMWKNNLQTRRASVTRYVQLKFLVVSSQLRDTSLRIQVRKTSVSQQNS